jgi:hypothetical protein
VCPGFDHTIAYPGVTASSAPIDSPPYDVWGALSFGPSSANDHAVWMRAGSLDWGHDTYACP